MTCTKINLHQGLQVSRIVAGMWRMADWNLSIDERLRLISQCLDLGISTFDHADIYGNGSVESLFGEALAKNSSLKNKIQIITKCGIQLPSITNGVATIKHYNLIEQHIKHSVDCSLQKLGVEKIDLLLIHRPSPLMDFDALTTVFKDIQATGKVLQFGVSNFTPTQFFALNRRFPLSTNQVEFSPLTLNALDNGLFDGLQDLNIKPMIWSALAGGQLFSNTSAHAARIHSAFINAGQKMGLSTAGAVYAWIMRLPCHPIILTGSGRIQNIADAVEACNIKMDELLWFELLEVIRNQEVA